MNKRIENLGVGAPLEITKTERPEEKKDERIVVSVVLRMASLFNRTNTFIL
jgi:hypothetical protein